MRAVTTVVNGQVQVVSRHDYMPFGEEVNPPNPLTDTRLFTGKERDFEAGQDYFGARYLLADLGRFTTVDPASPSDEELADPQSWNRYGYARENPLRFTDPDGRTIQVLDSRSLQLILGTLPEELRRYVILTSKRMIDAAALNKVKTKDANFLALAQLANSSEVVQVSSSDRAVIVTDQGKREEYLFSYAWNGEFLGVTVPPPRHNKGAVPISQRQFRSRTGEPAERPSKKHGEDDRGGAVRPRFPLCSGTAMDPWRTGSERVHTGR